jgi:hypothetical protein
MIAVAVSILLLGIVLGMRYRALVLVPTLGLTLTTVIAVGIAGGNAPGAIAAAVALVSCGLQFGYVFGAFIHFGVIADRVAKARFHHRPRVLR